MARAADASSHPTCEHSFVHARSMDGEDASTMTPA
jgi:hypothetical protein